MIRVVRYEDLGVLNLDWLSARYHFSFANYHNAARMGFGALRVVNDDTIAPHSGFETHRHRNMEIVTFVREGVITHKDSFGHEGHLHAGDVQVMSAGAGIEHSEFNLQDTQARMYQIWIVPRARNTEPRWDMARFRDGGGEGLRLIASGIDGDAPLFINQDARIYAGAFVAGQHVRARLEHQGYVLVSKGEVRCGDGVARAGDGIEITDQHDVEIVAQSDAEIVVLDVVAG